MFIGSTPTQTFRVNIDLTNAVVIYVTYKQGGRTVIEKTRADDMTVSSSCIEFRLTQEDTLALSPGDVEIQISARLPDGNVLKSRIIKTSADRVLKEGKI